MPLSMSPNAHYVTQQSLWGGPQMGKRLTNRRIAQLQKQGHYGSPFVRLQAVETKRKERKKKIEDLFVNF